MNGTSLLKKKRIALMVSNLCTLGGTERVTAILSKELCKYYDVSIITQWQSKKTVYDISKQIEVFNLYPEKKRLRHMLFDGTNRIKKLLKIMELKYL